jgi:hypothetical protein
MHQVFNVFALQQTVALEEEKQKMKTGGRLKVWNGR